MKFVTTVFGAMLLSALWFAPAAFAQGNCETEVQACMNAALDGYAECTEGCNIYDGKRWDICTDRCEAKTRRSENACEAETSCRPVPLDRSGSASTPPRPAKAQGNGCYLGECPDDLTPDTTPRAEPVSKPDPYSSAPSPQQVQFSWLCQTPQHWCMMNQSPQALPVGSPCYCMNPIFGYANGMVIPQQ